MFEWKFASKTDVGKRRQANEDCVNTNSELGFAILADGMGGHKGGEIASAMAVSGIAEDLKDAVEVLADGETPDSQTMIISELLTSTISKVNKAILASSQSTEQYQGMGTTIVVTVIDNDRVSFAHVGDSRLYRLRNDTLEQLTSDHSLVNELLAQGYYKSQEEAAAANQKNVITRAVGIGEAIEVDTSQTESEEGDIYLLCSDGLSDMVSDGVIEKIMIDNKNDIDVACNKLVEQANEDGGRDNISVILIQANKGSLLKKSLKWLFKS